MSEYFKHTPAVFAVDKYYQIMMPCEKSCLFFVKVGDKIYYDESNGIMCSRNKIHRVEVPAAELDKAIDIWEQYLVHDDRNITVLTRVADAYRKIRDFRKSKQLYLKVLDMEDDNAYALIGLGHLHYDFKEYRDAQYYWTKMLDLNDSAVDIRVLTSIGNCHRKLKTYDKDVYYFERALEMDPKNFYALFGLADCYRGMNQQYRSVEYWNKILEIDPKNKVILTRAGDAYRNTGDYATATEYYQKALNIEFDLYAVLGLALISKGQGKFEEAISRSHHTQNVLCGGVWPAKAR